MENCHNDKLTKFCPMFFEDEAETLCRKFNKVLIDSGKGSYGTLYEKCQECINEEK